MIDYINKLFYGEKWHENLFLYLLYFSWTIYFIALFGFTILAPKKLSLLQNILKIYVALFLIVKFNIYNKGNELLSRFDKKVAFTSGIFLLLTTALTTIVENYIEEIRNYIKY